MWIASAATAKSMRASPWSNYNGEFNAVLVLAPVKLSIALALSLPPFICLPFPLPLFLSVVISLTICLPHLIRFPSPSHSHSLCS